MTTVKTEAAQELYEAGSAYMDSVMALFKIDPETRACFAEGSPTKSQAVFDRFTAFNRATHEFAAALARARGDAPSSKGLMDG